MALKIKGQTVIDDDRGLGDISKIGIGTTSNPKGAKLLVDVGSGVTAVIVQGSEGQLFSVTNELTTGSIFSVNDVSGIPSIDVDADGTIQLAPLSATEFVGIGITNPTEKLHVNGDVRIVGILTVGSSSISIDGSNNQIRVGTAVTIDHSNGIRVGNTRLHSTGLEVDSISISGQSVGFGSTGPAGSKGQKGEVGQKGQKGEAGSSGSNGSKGQKG